MLAPKQDFPGSLGQGQGSRRWGIHAVQSSSRRPASGRVGPPTPYLKVRWQSRSNAHTLPFTLGNSLKSMDYLQGQVEGLQWTLSSPTSCASPIEFAVGSSQWSLEPISDPPSRPNLSVETHDVDLPSSTGPQWTFQHVDSTFRNTIISHSGRISELGATPFPISRRPSLPSSKQRPRIVIDSPTLSIPDIRITPGSTTPMFPPRERVRGLDSPMLGLFHTLLPLSPALSSNQLKLVPTRAWSPIAPNNHLHQPPPSAISGSSTPRPAFIMRQATALKVTSGSELGETPSLRRTLDSLDHRLCELLEERMQVQSQLAHAASKLSPISRLPAEILMQIFEFGVNTRVTRGLAGSEGLAPIPETGGLFLGAVRRVCRTWREVAESTPSLWAAITIDMHNSLKNAEMRLQRSRSAPLDIQIAFTDRVTYAGNVTGALLDAFNLLQPHMARWRSLRVEVPGHAHARAALRFCAGSAPHLKEFSLHVGAQKFSRNIRELPWMLEETTSLTTLSLTSVNFGWDGMIAPFKNLSSIYLSDYWFNSAPSCFQLLSIFDACSGTLADLTLRNMTDCDSEEELELVESLCYVPQIALPRLKHATFYFCGSSRLSILLSRLVLPALNHLEISYLDDVSMPLGMICQQKAEDLPLEALIINSSLIVEEQLVRLLRRLPELESLELADCEDVSPFLLTELSSPEELLCPNLRLLSIDGCTSVDSQAIRFLVGSRLTDQWRSKRPNAVPIQELHISRCLQISPDTVQWLRMYVPTVHREF